MDPITHAVVGIGLAVITGEPLTLANPALIGCLTGAVIPDSDIVVQFAGHEKYLKNHRGISHSLLLAPLYTAAITGALMLFYGHFDVKRVLAMTLLGILSHLTLDLTNPYGASIFSPFSQKKITFDLLLVFDPVIALLFGLLILPYTRALLTPATLVFLLVAYIGFRYLLKNHGMGVLLEHVLERYEIKRLRLLPSMTGFFKWQFVMETTKGNVVGEVHGFRKKVRIVDELEKIDDSLMEMAMATPVAEYFKEFTPYFHIKCERVDDHIQFRYIDLRYFVTKEYLHNGTALVSEEEGFLNGQFHPYHLSRSIEIL